MGSGFRRYLHTRMLPVVAGTVVLDCGGQRLTATVLHGEAELSLIEDGDQLAGLFAESARVRWSPRERLRLMVEADLDGMTIKLDPVPGNG